MAWQKLVDTHDTPEGEFPPVLGLGPAEVVQAAPFHDSVLVFASLPVMVGLAS